MGFHLAMQANPREAGLLFYIASAAKTVGEALALFERYFRIVNEAVRLKLMRVPNGAILQVGFVGLSRFHVQQNAEFGIAVILKALREVVGRNIRPTKVGFMQGHASNLREFERFYGCPVEFGHRPISSSSRLRRWLCRSSPKIRTCLRRSSRFVMPPRESAALEKERFVPWSRTKCKQHCRTATFANRASRKRSVSARERSRADWPTRV